MIVVEGTGTESDVAGVGATDSPLGIGLFPAGAGTGGGDGDGGGIGTTTLLDIGGEGRGPGPGCPEPPSGKPKPPALMQVVVPSMQMSGTKQQNWLLMKHWRSGKGFGSEHASALAG